MKKLYLFLAMGCFATTVWGQSAIDAYRFSQPDLKGTARSLGMGGAFGALGGDLSSISINPAGIGVYRSNEIGTTMEFSFGNASSNSQGMKTDKSNFNYYFDNIGGVASMRLFNSQFKNFNVGFTYNKRANFDRKYGGAIPNLQTSMSNYVAGVANNSQITEADVTTTAGFNPYNPTDGGYAAPWITILGFDGFLINPTGNVERPDWLGQFGDGTSGSGYFNVEESGGVEEFNIALGGNISDVVYWGMNFNLVGLEYKMDAMWGESLKNAYVFNPAANEEQITNSEWRLSNSYRANGNGFSYQAGLILKPVQELRLGFAFQTPTFYNIEENYIGGINANYFGKSYSVVTNNRSEALNNYNFKTPWKLNMSAAGVFDSRFILSADWELNFYKGMRFSEEQNDYYDYGYGYDNNYYYTYYTPAPLMAKEKQTRGGMFDYDPFGETNNDITNYFNTTSNIRLGAEYRVTPNVSLRAGYSLMQSPYTEDLKNDRVTVYTSGTMPNYVVAGNTNCLTAGAGYRSGGFYIDMAYVFKTQNSTYHAFTPDPGSSIKSPQSDLTFNTSRIVLSTGVRF